MQNERTRLKSLEKTSITSSDRDSLLRAAGGSAKAEAAETVATRDLTTQQLVERTQAEMKMQDEVLEDMSTGLTSLHKVSTAIKDEVTLHVVSGAAGGRLPGNPSAPDAPSPPPPPGAPRRL